MNIIEKAYRQLFPEKEFNYNTRLKYSGKFNDYGANIRVARFLIEVKLSKKWYRVSNEIKIGLIQELLVKIFKAKKQTTYMDLYNTFIKKLASVTPKTEMNVDMLNSFNRVNQKYFDDFIEVPNLRWGYPSTSRLGSYDFKTDTITISSVLENETELLDYVMYHEMLHKKHKFKANQGRNLFHSSKFRKEEKQFECAEKIEKKLKRLSFKSSIRKLLPF